MIVLASVLEHGVALASLILGGAVVGKYHNAKTALAAVKAEVAKIESEAKGEVQMLTAEAAAELAKVAPAVLAAVARVKALL